MLDNQTYYLLSIEGFCTFCAIQTCSQSRTTRVDDAFCKMVTCYYVHTPFSTVRHTNKAFCLGIAYPI